MNNLLRETYFLLRPRLPGALRLGVRRLFLKRTLRRNSSCWPISQQAKTPPDWWQGWPKGKRFAFVLSHDVEGRKGLDRVLQLAGAEVELGFRSSFYFVPEGEYQTPISLRNFLTELGFEVGVHDLTHDGRLYHSRDSFRQSAQEINRYLQEWGSVGFRSGFMLHDLDWLRDLNVLYDGSSFDSDPFEPQPEGVNTIFPFWVGRPNGSGYVELPYTLPQDSTLFLLFHESGIDIWRRKLDWIAQEGGMALVNVHPDYVGLDGPAAPLEYKPELYTDLLKYVRDRYADQAWCALPKEVAAYASAMRSSFYRSEAKLSRAVTTCPPSEGPIQAPSAVSLIRGLSHVELGDAEDWRLRGNRAAMVTFSPYPGDPRPRRAAETLVARGMEVDLICIAENPGDARQEVVNGVNIHRVSIKRRRGGIFTYCFQYLAFLLISGAILAARSFRRRYRLVHVHNMPDILVLSALVPKLFGAKVILDLHDPMPELMVTIFGLQPDSLSVRLLKRAEAWSIAFADSVITVNRACAKLFSARSCPAQKLSVIMNSPDERIFRFRRMADQPSQARASRKPFVIMYHGSLVERNGLDLAVDAVSRVQQSIPGVKLRIYGASTPFLDKVMRSVRERGLNDMIECLGPKTLEELVHAIRDCDLGIIPNRRSVFTELNTPTRIFEYLALGTPVIAPRAQGICDYFDETSLIFFELGNAQDLAEKIEYTYSCPVEVNKILERGQQVYQQHSWPAERSRLVSLVTGLLYPESLRIALESAETASPKVGGCKTAEWNA